MTLKNQVILTVIESKKYLSTGKASYFYGGLEYVIEKGADNLPHVVTIKVPNDFDLNTVQVIIRK